MSTTKHTLSEETLNEVLSIKDKLLNEKNKSFFTSEDRIIIYDAYKELTGKDPCKTCSTFLDKAKLSVINFLKLYEREQMEKVIIEDRVLQPVEEVETTKASTDYSNMSLKELREIFPNIKSRSKDDFISKIKENGNEEEE